MSDSNNNLASSIDSAQDSIVERLSKGAVSSVSVDGMSTSYQSLDQQLKALSALRRLEAAKNPLGAMKIFKVKNTER